MTVREGSLEAPTRHPIDWKNPEYYALDRILEEAGRIFDICHGCRRCVSLCNAFPTLFDLIDEGPTGELDGVPKEKYWNVIDQCYLCDMCYMVKCPYVPPHPWNVDFPHTMLRAKAYQFKNHAAAHPQRDRLLSSNDLGRFAAIPIVAQTVNAAGKSAPARAMGEKVMSIAKAAWVPSYAPRKFTSAAPKSKPHPVREGTRAPGKVAIFATCYVNYNEPAIGLDLLRILDHNEVPYVMADYKACCGMPKLELGDLDSVAKLKEKNMPELARLAREGYAIITPVPSCTLMFKQEIPLMFPDDPDVIAVRDATFDTFEYLMARSRDGLLKTDFKQPLGKVAYHVPCHTRVQKIGLKTREALESVPGTEVLTIERCSGHAGTWGVKQEFHQTALKIGRPVMRQIAEFAPDYFASDCELAGHHLEEGVGENKGRARLRHPITLLRMAYGLPD